MEDYFTTNTCHLFNISHGSWPTVLALVQYRLHLHGLMGFLMIVTPWVSRCLFGWLSYIMGQGYTSYKKGVQLSELARSEGAS